MKKEVILKFKLVFASSREYYGEQDNLPVTEESPPNPKNPYAASKVAGEAIIRGYLTDYMILRLANVIGPGDHDRVAPLFIKRALKNELITINGAGKVLDFIDVNENQID